MLHEAFVFILYLFYGLAFFFIGTAIVSRNLRVSSLKIAGMLVWLALFGFSHAIYEWLVLFLIIYQPSLQDSLSTHLYFFKEVLGAVSFFFLFWFGYKLSLLDKIKLSKFCLLVVVWIVIGFFWSKLFGDQRYGFIIRYFICFPGGMLTSIGFIRYARQVRHLSPKGAGYFVAAGGAMLAYATLAGLVPSRTVIFEHGIPIEFFRMVAAVVFVHFLMKALHVFDIERQDKIEERLHRFAQSSKMTSLGKLAAGIAHEINNPLANVLLNVEMLEKNLESKPSSDSSKRLQAIKRNLDRASKIAQELLYFSRNHETEFIRVELNNVIQSSLEILGKRDQQYETVLQLNDLPAFDGIPWKIEEVLVNLVINAMDASATGSQIIISTRYDGSKVICQVKDQGSGISPENKKFIFDPFFTTKMPGEGTGLGLSICYGIMELHDGEIVVESAPEQGTTVSLIFPIKDKD